MSAISIAGDTSGSITLQAPAVAGATTLILPASAGSANQVLTSDGAGNLAFAAPSSGRNIEIFSSSGSWPVPAGVTSIIVTVIGGGGGGGGSTISGQAGGFGGNGGVGVALIQNPSGTIVVTIGSGGTGSNTAGGTAGGTSSFGSFVSCTGGAGGDLNGGYIQGVSGVATIGGGATTLSTRIQSTPEVVEGILPNSGTGASPFAYSTTAPYGAGKGGYPETNTVANNAAGGVGGAVVIEW